MESSIQRVIEEFVREKRSQVTGGQASMNDRQLRSRLSRSMHCNLTPQIAFSDVSMQQP